MVPTRHIYHAGRIGEIIGFYRSLTDKETSYIHEHLMKSGVLLSKRHPSWLHHR